MAVRSGPRSPGRALLVISAPLVLLVGGVLITRFGYVFRSNSHVSDSMHASLSGAQPDLPLNSLAITRDRRALNAIDARAAYDNAKSYVLRRIPPHDRANVRFSGWPPPPGSKDNADGTEIDRLAPNLWRVRGSVVWRHGKPADPPIKERFEADLTHGPTDDRWRLIDTEWLDASWMPRDSDDGNEGKE